MEIRSELFLQHCCFLQIIDYKELKLNIPYFSECDHFSSFPHIIIQSKDDGIKFARLEKLKKNNQLKIQHLLSEKESLKSKVDQLKIQIKKQKSETNDVKKEFYHLQNLIFELNNHEYNEIKNSVDLFYNQKLERNYILKKDEVEKYKLLFFLVNRILKVENHPDFYKFCSLLYLLNEN